MRVGKPQMNGCSHRGLKTQGEDFVACGWRGPVVFVCRGKPKNASEKVCLCKGCMKAGLALGDEFLSVCGPGGDVEHGCADTRTVKVVRERPYVQVCALG